MYQPNKSKKNYDNQKPKNFRPNKKRFYKEEDLEDELNKKHKPSTKDKNKEPLSQIDCYLIEKDKHRKSREYKKKDKEKRNKYYD